MTENHPESEAAEFESDNDVVIEAELVETSLDDGSRYPNRLSVSGVISWCVVAAITVAVVALVATTQQTVSEEVGGDATSGDLMQVQLVGKMLVGQQQLQAMSSQMLVESGYQEPAEDAEDAEAAEGSDAPKPLSDEEIKAIEAAIEAANIGTFEQQLACVVLANELIAPERAQEMLDDLNDRVQLHGFVPSENQSTLRAAVSNVVEACVNDSFDDATLSIEEEDLLAEKMGWIGRLAAVPVLSGKAAMRAEVVSEATTSAMVCTAAMMLGVLAMLTGFVLAILTIRRWKAGGFESRFENRSGVHNIYIETFAIWLVYFFGIQFAFGAMADTIPIDPLVLNPFIFFSSLLVLVWPVLRGIPFRQVRQDIGWTSTRPVRDLLASPAGYLATLPMVFVTFALMAGLITQSMQPQDSEEFSRGQTISHPIQEYVSDSDANVMLWVVLAACVAAPIVEETVFRGILYRHLRDWTAHWRLVASVFFSSIVNAFMFAAIHPQGVMLIPVLGALAVGFSLMREWRGSLYPSMIMHAIHNSLVTCLMFTIL